MRRRLLAMGCIAIAGIGVGCGSEAAPPEETAPTLGEQVKQLNRGRPQQPGITPDPLVSAPELIGVPLDEARARLEVVKDNARRAFRLGRIDRIVDFQVATEIVEGFTSDDDELVVSGYVVGTEPGADLIANGARVTLYAVPADRFEKGNQSDTGPSGY